jgi:hypothetical protein
VAVNGWQIASGMLRKFQSNRVESTETVNWCIHKYYQRIWSITRNEDSL